MTRLCCLRRCLQMCFLVRCYIVLLQMGMHSYESYNGVILISGCNSYRYIHSSLDARSSLSRLPQHALLPSVPTVTVLHGMSGKHAAVSLDEVQQHRQKLLSTTAISTVLRHLNSAPDSDSHEEKETLL